MKIAIVAGSSSREEIRAGGVPSTTEISWLEHPAAVAGVTAIIDLAFDGSAGRLKQLQSLQPATIIVNAVQHTLEKLAPGFIRINGWSSLLKRPIVEAAAAAADREKAEKVFEALNKQVEWVADVPGFITPRVISAIINEAWFTLDEQVSTKEEIDTAMKLGTNYPYGPFEWGEKIGLHQVFALLEQLSATQPRYTPSALLKKQIHS